MPDSKSTAPRLLTMTAAADATARAELLNRRVRPAGVEHRVALDAHLGDRTVLVDGVPHHHAVQDESQGGELVFERLPRVSPSEPGSCLPRSA